MVSDPYTAPHTSPDDERRPPFVGAPLLTAFLLFIVLPLLVVLVVLWDWLFG